MASHDALTLVAEVAITIAGFSSVVAALNNQAVKYWTPFQRHNLRILLEVSALTIMFSIFPFIVELIVSGPKLWKWALGIYGVVHILDVTSFILRLPKYLPKLHRILPYVGLTLAIAKVFVAWLAAPIAAEAFYLCSLVWHLGIAALGFVYLVMGEPGAGTS